MIISKHLQKLSFALLWLGLSACPNETPTPKATQLSVGVNHTCALLDTGEVKCWGNNFSGQLGVGNTEAIGDNEAVSSGSKVALGGKATQVVGGGGFTCALLDTGAVRCWGLGNVGQLGYGNTNNIGDDETPASAGDVDLGGLATQITAGNSHVCALLDTGNVRCWGSSNRGALGYGNLNDIGDDEAPSTAGDVNLGFPALQISAGTNSTCALLQGGSVRCWGRFNNLGQGPAVQLNTDIGDDETPAAIGDINLGGLATQISANLNHVCALLDTGNVRCWGVNFSGALGYPGVFNVGRDNTPADQGDVDLGGNAVHIETGANHTCALLDTGEVKCWGDAEFGQLGLGNDDSIGLQAPPSSVEPINLGGKVTQLAANFFSSCALLEDSTIHCWGDNLRGQLGIGNNHVIGDNEAPSTAGDIDLGGNAVDIIAGGASSCAILDGGAVRCWGDVAFGQNGYGLQTDIGDNETPASVGDLDLGGSAVQLSAKRFRSCAVLDTGAVRCWGENEDALLGYGFIGNVGDDETPASVGDVELGGFATQAATGSSHTCALLDTGAVRCWGFSFNGELGYGNTLDVGIDNAPSSGGDLDLGGTAVQITAGSQYSCALLDTGAVRCWGFAIQGRLGYGNTNDIGDDETPASAGDVDLGGTAVQIATGIAHTCALLDTGAVRCWGFGGLGQLGYGNTDDIGDDETPASAGDVDLGGLATKITAGENYTCALLDTGAVRCWGLGNLGALGYSAEENIGDDETPASAGDVDLGGTAISVSAGTLHTCAVLDNGKARCWGANFDGELGYGNDSDIGDSEIPADHAVELF